MLSGRAWTPASRKRSIFRAIEASSVRSVFCEEHPLIFLKHCGAVSAQLIPDDGPVSDGVIGLTGYQVEQGSRALDVAEKFDAEPLPGCGAFDEARDIREDELVVHAERWLECGERVVRNLLLCTSELVEETLISPHSACR